MGTILNSLILLVCVSFTHASNDTDNKLQELQKEKEELIVKIQNAIEDSANALQNSNDSTGLFHLKELQKQFNESLIEDEINELLSNKSARRNQQPRYLKKGKLKLDLFDLAGLFSNKKVKANQAERDRNQAIMREKLREWMLKRELERKQIKKYRQREQYINENCPKMGNKSKKKKKKKSRRRAFDDGKNRRQAYNDEENREQANQDENNRRQAEGNMNDTRKAICDDLSSSHDADKRPRRRQPRVIKYPCCRKCCKSSYLGCL